MDQRGKIDWRRDVLFSWLNIIWHNFWVSIGFPAFCVMCNFGQCNLKFIRYYLKVIKDAGCISSQNLLSQITNGISRLFSYCSLMCNQTLSNLIRKWLAEIYRLLKLLLPTAWDWNSESCPRQSARNMNEELQLRKKCVVLVDTLRTSMGRPLAVWKPGLLAVITPRTTASLCTKDPTVDKREAGVETPPCFWHLSVTRSDAAHHLNFHQLLCSLF